MVVFVLGHWLHRVLFKPAICSMRQVPSVDIAGFQSLGHYRIHIHLMIADITVGTD
jgi:copper(I)-binding protein